MNNFFHVNSLKSYKDIGKANSEQISSMILIDYQQIHIENSRNQLTIETLRCYVRLALKIQVRKRLLICKQLQ